VVETEIPTTTISAPINWTVIIAAVAALVFGIPTVLFSLRLLEVLSETNLVVIGAIVGTMALVVVVTFCWTRVVMAYSELRSREEAADDVRELDLLRAVQGGAAPNMAPTYQVGTPVDQAALMELVRQQQPAQVPATVIDFEQPVSYE